MFQMQKKKVFEEIWILCSFVEQLKHASVATFISRLSWIEFVNYIKGIKLRKLYRIIAAQKLNRLIMRNLFSIVMLLWSYFYLLAFFVECHQSMSFA